MKSPGQCDIRVVHRTQTHETDITEMVESVTWTGDITQAYRKLDVSLVNTQDSRRIRHKIELGDEIRFFNYGKELFRGVVFSLDIGINGKQSLTCYDYNVYLVKNEDTRKFSKVTASQIVRRLCRDFDIPTGTIEDTGYVIPRMIFEKKTLFEMMLMALTETEKQTGRRFFITNRQGRLELLERRKQVRQWVIENGVNLIDAGYSLSIEDMRNQIKVIYRGEDAQTITEIARNNRLIERYGRMQHVEEVNEEKTRSQLRQLARQLLNDLATIDDEARITALGIDEVTAGTAIYVKESMTGIVGGFYVSDDQHNFANGAHGMSLTLSATDDLPRLEYEEGR